MKNTAPSTSLYFPATIVRCFILLVCSAVLARGENSATVSGFVRDKNNGESLPFANVIVTELKIGTSTNTEGYFAIANIPEGIFHIQVSLLGYRQEVFEINTNERNTIVFNIVLVSEAIQVAGVTVSAERTDQKAIPQTSRIILQAEELKAMPSIGETDVFRSLQLLPGVKASSEISSGLYIRGGGPDQNLILLDETVVYNPSHLFGFFSTFNNDAVKDIELIKGGFPAEYGGRLSSVLNVLNKDGNRMNFQGKGSVSLISSRLTGEGPIGNGSWFLSGRRTYLDALVRIAGLNTGKDPLPLYYFYDMNGKFNQSIDEGNQLSFVGYLGQDNLNFNQNNGELNIDLTWGNRTGSLKYTHIFSPTIFSHFVATGSFYRSQISGGMFSSKFLFDNTVSDYSLKGDLEFYANNDHLTKIGVWWSQYRFGVLRKFGDNVFYDIAIRPAMIALYAQDEWNVDERWKVQAGLRFEYQDASKQFKIGPRFSARYFLTPDITLKAASGVYYQYLNLVSQEGFSFFDMWAPINNKMNPGRAIDVVLGAETSPFVGYDLNVETYFKFFYDLVELKSEALRTAEINELFNIGNGRAYGLELFFQKKIGSVTGFIGYSLAWTFRNFPEINHGKDYQPKYDRRHDISLVASYQVSDNWKLGAIYTYGTGQTYTAGIGRTAVTTLEQRYDIIIADGRYNQRLEPYHRLDLSVTKKTSLFGVNGSWYIQIFNVYNHRNVWFKQFDTGKNPVEITDVRLLPIVPTFGFDFEF